MNQILAEKYRHISPANKKSLRNHFADAPRALKLLSFLSAHDGVNFSMAEIVNGVYPEKQISFQVRQNRFFKLRQKMMDAFADYSSEAKSVNNLFPLEQQYFECRDKMNANHFHLAAKGFAALIKECREKNVFELLHLALSGLIYCHQALNDRKDQFRMQDEYDEAIALNHDLQKAHALHRRMYALNSERRFDECRELMEQMKQLAAQRKSWPRFAYYYAFVEMTIGSGGTAYNAEQVQKAVNRVDAFYKKYKNLPCVNYEAYYREIVHYNVEMIRGILAFSNGDSEKAYQHIFSAFNVAEETPGIRVRRTDSLFINLITVSVGTARYETAIKVSQQLIDFHRQQKEDNKRLAAYATLAMIYTYCFDKIPCPDPEFMLKKLDEYIRSEKKSGGKGIADAYATKAVFLYMLRRFHPAARIMRRPGMEGLFDRYGLPEYTDLLKLNPASPRSRVADLKKRIVAKMKATKSTEVIQHYRRALKLLELV